jgi:hypothetical protein
MITTIFRLKDVVQSLVLNLIIMAARLITAARKIPKGQAIVFSTCCRNIGREGYMTSGYGTFAGDCG